jgi:hypothetical protein
MLMKCYITNTEILVVKGKFLIAYWNKTMVVVAICIECIQFYAQRKSHARLCGLYAAVAVLRGSSLRGAFLGAAG